MKKGLTLAAVAVLALGAAACHKPDAADTNNVSSTDNMLVPADENAVGDANATDNLAVDNSALDNGSANAM